MIDKKAEYIITAEMIKLSAQAATVIIEEFYKLGEKFFPYAIIGDKTSLDGYSYLIKDLIANVFLSLDEASTNLNSFRKDFFVETLGEAFNQIVTHLLQQANLEKLKEKKE